MAKSRYYDGRPRRKFEDDNGRELTDPRPLRTAVQDAQSIKDLKQTMFVNNRVMDDTNYEADEHIADDDGEEFSLPGIGRYEEFADRYDEQSKKIRASRAEEIASEQKIKRERYEKQQRLAAKKRYGLLDIEDVEPKKPSDSESET